MMKQLLVVSFLWVAVLAVEDEKVLMKLFNDGNHKFSAKLFSEVAKVNPGKSFAVSTYSVMTSLAQISIASRGETLNQLWQAIGICNEEDVLAALQMTNPKYQSLQGETLKTATKIYLSKPFDVYKEAGASTWNYFSRSPENIDFEQKQEAANEINSWVEQETNHAIKYIVSAEDFQTEDNLIFIQAILVDADYFKGIWAEPFDARLTSEVDFKVNENITVKVPMMNRKGTYRYTNSSFLKSQIIEISYKGSETSLVVVLPLKVEYMKELEEKLKDPLVLDNVLNQMKETEIDLHLPKFKIETTTDLKDVLQKVNVKNMFQRGHNLQVLYGSRTTGNMYFNLATQKTFIEVDEGADSTAGNLTNIDEIVGSQSNVFNANHPFMFFVIQKDKNTGNEDMKWPLQLLEMGIIATSFIPQYYANAPFYFLGKFNYLILFNGVMYGN